MRLVPRLQKLRGKAAVLTAVEAAARTGSCRADERTRERGYSLLRFLSLAFWHAANVAVQAPCGCTSLVMGEFAIRERKGETSPYNGLGIETEQSLSRHSPTRTHRGRLVSAITSCGGVRAHLHPRGTSVALDVVRMRVFEQRRRGEVEKRYSRSPSPHKHAYIRSAAAYTFTKTV